MSKPPRKKDVVEPGQLLDMWMGGESPAPPPRRRPGWVDLVGIIVLVVAVIVLARFALDVLLLLVGLAVAIFIIHEVMQLIARSDLLTPGSLLIVALIVGLFAWLVVPNSIWVSWGRSVPRPIAAFFDWAEERGIGGTAFVATSGGGATTSTASAAATPRPAASSPTSRPSSSAPAAAPSITLSASASRTRLGQPVVFTARLNAASATAGGSVRFYDGVSFLGSGVIREEGRAKVAYLTVTNLPEGEHDIRAEALGALGLEGRPAAPLRHTVTR